MKIVIDTREQTPLDFEGVEIVTKKLATGDYSVFGLEGVVAIERKNGLDELAAMVGRERKRWERCLQRMSEMEIAMVVVENSPTTLPGMGLKRWRCDITLSQMSGSVLAWMADYQVPFVFVADEEQASEVVLKLLKRAEKKFALSA